MIKMQNIYPLFLPKTRIDKNVIKLVSGTVCTASIIKDNLNSTVPALLLCNNGFIITWILHQIITNSNNVNRVDG